RRHGRLLRHRVPPDVDGERQVAGGEPPRAGAVGERLARRHVRRRGVLAIEIQPRLAEEAAADVTPAVAVAEVERDLRHDRAEMALDRRALRHGAAGLLDVERLAPAAEQHRAADAESDLPAAE